MGCIQPSQVPPSIVTLDAATVAPGVINTRDVVIQDNNTAASDPTYHELKARLELVEQQNREQNEYVIIVI